MTEHEPLCCEPSCTSGAEFEVEHQCGDPYCDTQACGQHLGVLIGHVEGGGGAPEADTWLVRSLVTVEVRDD